MRGRCFLMSVVIGLGLIIRPLFRFVNGTARCRGHNFFVGEFSKIIEALVEAEKIVENQQNYAKNSTRNRFFFIPFPHFQSLSENPTRQSDTDVTYLFLDGVAQIW